MMAKRPRNELPPLDILVAQYYLRNMGLCQAAEHVVNVGPGYAGTTSGGEPAVYYQVQFAGQPNELTESVRRNNDDLRPPYNNYLVVTGIGYAAPKYVSRGISFLDR